MDHSEIPAKNPARILVAGATGYIGGRLVLRLLDAGYRVRAMARSMDKIKGRFWQNHPGLEAVKADIHDIDSLDAAFSGCDMAYYLVHSMSEVHPDFARADRHAARNFAAKAGEHGLKRIIYLGGLGGREKNTSPHLKSRSEVEDILCSGPVPATVFRSAHIIGSGSASFEMLRYTAERMPFFIVPESVIDTYIQPVCIRNVLTYLKKCLDKEDTIGRSFDIGGPEVLTYRRLFEIYALQAGLKRPVFITSYLPRFKLGTKVALTVARLLLPVSQDISKPLLEGLGVETIAKENTIRDIIPQDLVDIREAIERAIQKDSLKIVETRWSDAGSLNPPEWVYEGDAAYSGGTLLQGGYKMTLDCAPKDIWPLISRIGGHNGWYYGDILWQIRGWMDQFAGGVGLRRGRRHPELLAVGDTLDFWRVLDIRPPYRLVLLAEMKLPGEALLDIELKSAGTGTQILFGTRFRPIGLYGILYWYVLLPFHNLLFGGLLRTLAEKVGRPVLARPENYRPGPLLFSRHASGGK